MALDHWFTYVHYWSVIVILHCFMVISTYLQYLCTSTTMDYPSRPKLPRIGQEHSENFQQMIWPPHLCPIKHLWDIMERSIHIQGPVLKNITMLWTAIETALAQCLSRGYPTTCWINTMLSCCTLQMNFWLLWNYCFSLSHVFFSLF